MTKLYNPYHILTVLAHCNQWISYSYDKLYNPGHDWPAYLFFLWYLTLIMLVINGVV